MVFTPHTKEEINSMLKTIGVNSIEDLLTDIPSEVRQNSNLNLPKPMTEQEAARHVSELAEKNFTKPHLSFLGAGIYNHFIPSIISAALSKQEFFTAYTPYQPEISQGTLRLMFDFQSLICSLTGMDISNSSLYDGASAAAEAANITIAKTGRKKILVAKSLHPEYKKTIKTLTQGRQISVEEILYRKDGSLNIQDLEKKIGDDVAALIVHQPNFLGSYEVELEDAAKITKDNGAFLCVGAYPITLPLVKTPAEVGANIAFGEAQCLGNAPNFGGPGLGYIAVEKELLRLLPGRLCGETKEKIQGTEKLVEGNTGYVLTIATREQHIKREKATSNICSNQALCAAAATIFGWYMGSEGLTKLAETNTLKAHHLQKEMEKLGFELVFPNFFNEFVVKSPIKNLDKKLRKKGITGPYQLKKSFKEFDKKDYMFCVTDIHEEKDIEYLLDCLKKESGLK